MKQEKQQAGDESRKFEKALQRLEEIVAAMEKGDLPLEQTLQHFEEGMGLAKSCSEKLGDAEKRIEVLSGKNQQGQDLWPPFEPAAEEEP